MRVLAQTNFTALGFRLALFMLLSLFVGMAVREYARAWMATRLGDPTSRLWGRLGLGPSRWFEPFGSGLVPGLLAVLWAVGVFVIPAAYAKPAPIDPSYFRNGKRDVVLASLAGPLATLALGVLGGLALRGLGSPGESARFLAVFAFTNMALTVFHLLPIPGLDGARMVALTLPPQAAQVYRNADRYLPLFVLVVLFIFGTLVLGFLTALADALCSAAAGVDCRGFL